MRRDITGMLDGAHLNFELCNSLSLCYRLPLSLRSSFFSLFSLNWMSHNANCSSFMDGPWWSWRPLFLPIPDAGRSTKRQDREWSLFLPALRLQMMFSSFCSFPRCVLTCQVCWRARHHLPSLLTLASVFSEPLKSLIDFSTAYGVIGF